MNVPEVQATIRALSAPTAAIETACELMSLLADVYDPPKISIEVPRGWILMRWRSLRRGHGKRAVIFGDGRIFLDGLVSAPKAADRVRMFLEGKQ